MASITSNEAKHCFASWTGLHRHALLTMIAFAFLHHLRLGESRKQVGKRRPHIGLPPEVDLTLCGHRRDRRR